MVNKDEYIAGYGPGQGWGGFAPMNSTSNICFIEPLLFLAELLATDLIFGNCNFSYITHIFHRFYPNVTTLRSGLCYVIANPSVVCLSVTFVHGAPYSEVEAFNNTSLPLCTLAILWPPCKILRRYPRRTPSISGVKRKGGSKIQRFWTCWRLYLTNGTRYGLGYN